MIPYQRLIKKAIITSPLIAIYGVAPVFLFGNTNLQEALISFLGLMMGVFCFWLVNLWLAQKINQLTKRYLLSFCIILVLHSITSVFTLNFINDEPVLSKFFYAVIATLAVNTVILVIIDAELNKKQKELTEEENSQLRINNLEAQKRTLIQQLQPHFLFNTLSTLKSLIRESPSEAEDYTVKLSDFLRYTVQSSSKELVSLQEELGFTTDYLALQKKRFGEALNCSIEIPVKLLDAEIPIFALQALVENAIKHNRISEKNPLTITIIAIENLLKISNNRQPKVLQSVSGTGLSNLNERYLLVLGKPIEVITTETEFCVYLELLKK